MRIISCVPSISELIFDLRPQVLVGRTKFCVYPNSIKNIPAIGGTKTLDISIIKELKPDLVIAAKEENEKAQIDEISFFAKVKVFDVKTLVDCLDLISQIGELLQTKSEAEQLTFKIKNQLERLPFFEGKSMVYLIWQKPFITTGGDTFIHSVLKEIGLVNLYANQNRYPEISGLQQLKDIRPDFVFLSSEPFPFVEKHRLEFQAELNRSKVILVDGTYFSWYGSRMAMSWSYFKSIVESLQN